MTSHHPVCPGIFYPGNFASFAQKRFIDGCNARTDMEQASPENKKEEIARISLLAAEDDKIKDLYPGCRHSCGY